MRRPVDISKLLGSSNNEGKVEKPSFLTKKQRYELALEKHIAENKSQGKSSSITQSIVPAKFNPASAKVEEDYSHISERQKRSKFQFAWKQGDDTLAQYEPIVTTKVTHFLPRNAGKDSLEKVYMGKHWKDKRLDEMTERDWRILREDFNISTKGGSIRQPLRNWSELGIIPEELLHIITRKLHYTEPTPIQRVTIPNVDNGRDFLGVAVTGSGKTLAFLIPIIIKLNTLPPLTEITKLNGPYSLILAPTRELAQQIEAEARKLTQYWSRPCNVVSIVGGHAIEEISYNLSRGCEILVATPGRLIDCLENHVLVLEQVNILVLDEADRMIDYGFEDQLTTILSKTSSSNKRQTMMFTATMSPTIEKIADGYLNKPAYVTIGGEETKPQITQILEYLPSEEKRFLKLSKDILPHYPAPIIIFINYKRTADWLAKKFQDETKYRTTTLHGSKSQEQRENSLNLLRSGKADIMIATNVAGRGIDIPNVSLVVNFQMATKLEDYIHRIGRTGRAGKEGYSITFLGDEDENKLVDELYNYVKKNDTTGNSKISDNIKKRYNVGNNQLKAVIY